MFFLVLLGSTLILEDAFIMYSRVQRIDIDLVPHSRVIITFSDYMRSSERSSSSAIELGGATGCRG